MWGQQAFNAMNFGSVLQFELGVFSFHSLGGDLSTLPQERGMLSRSLRLGVLQEEVTDEQLQALSKQSQLNDSWNPGEMEKQEICIIKFYKNVKV